MRKWMTKILLLITLMLAIAPVTALADDLWTGTGTANDPYIITTEAGLTHLADQVNGGTSYAGTYFKLGGDIALTEAWPGIGIYKEDGVGTAFQGTFDGDGHTISNVVFKKIDNQNRYRGFFNQLYKATVKNLTVNGSGFGYTADQISSMPSGMGGAMIAGHAISSTLDNCVSKGTFTGTHNVAGIVVRIQGSTIKNCTNEADLTNGYSKLGGIVNLSQYGKIDTENKACVIEGCVNKGAITSTANGSNGVGGIIGWVGYGKDSNNSQVNVTIKGCQNTSIIQGDSTASIGQIVGLAQTYLSVLEGNRGLATQYGQSNDTQNMLSFATVENGEATYTNVFTAGKTYLVTAPNAKAQIQLGNGQSVTFDTSLSAPVITPMERMTLITQTGGSKETYTVASAQIGTEPYATVEEAMAAAGDTDTIKLLWDITSPVTVNKAVAFDLNEKTVSEVTVKDGASLTLSGKGTVTALKVEDGFAAVTKADTITVEAPKGYKWDNNKLALKDWSDLADTSWYNDTDTVFTLTTPEELAGLAKLVNAGNTFSGKTIKLGNDMDLSGAKNNVTGMKWTPIGNGTNYFKGVFDGDDHTIENLTVNQKANYAGLFGGMKTSEGTALPTIKNVTLNNVSVTTGSDYSYVGGLIGYAYNAVIENCAVTGSVQVQGKNYIGGIVGYGRGTFTDCTVSAAAGSTIQSNSGIGWSIGGIVGYCYGSVITEPKVENLTIASSQYATGGVAGAFQSDGGKNTIIGAVVNNCTIKTKNNVGAGVVVGMDNTSENTINCVLNSVVKNTTVTLSSASSPTTTDNIVGIYDTAAGYDNAALFIGTNVKLDASNKILTGTFTVFGESKASSALNSNSGWKKDGNVWIVNHCVAKIGDVKFETLADAVASEEAKGAAITLLEDVTGNILIDESITLDVGNYSLTGNVTITEDKHLTIKGTSTDNAITLLTSPGAKPGYVAEWYSDSAFTNAVSSTIITSASSKGASYYHRWEAIPYQITYDLQGGELETGAVNPVTYTTESETFTLKNPVKEGYIFAGWTGTGLSSATENVTIATGSTGDKAFTANWNVGYKVEHYKAVTGGYELADEEYLDGPVGDTVTAEAKQFEGFVYNAGISTAIGTLKEITSEAEKLVLKLYYDRNSSVIIPGGAVNYIVEHYQPEAGSYAVCEREYLKGNIGDTVTATPKEYEGFIYNASLSTATGTLKKITSPDDIVTLKLYYDKNTSTIIPGNAVNYVVEHYKAEAGSYAISEREYLKGNIGDTVTAMPKQYEGFIYNASLSTATGTLKKITGPDDIVILTLYYDKNASTIVPDGAVSYVVEHYKAEAGSYAVCEREYLRGNIGDSVTAAPKQFEGFIYNASLSTASGTLKKITGPDDIVILKLYYDKDSSVVIPGGAVGYIVEHYKAENSGYALRDVEYLKGNVGDTVTATPKQFVGFVYNAGISTASGTLKKITGESDIVTLKLYYDQWANYTIIQGMGQTVTPNSPATFVSDADFDKLEKVRVDGKLVDPSNYLAEEGSTKITLKEDYVKTLTEGEHTLTIISTDGSASTKFTVEKARTSLTVDTQPADQTVMEGEQATFSLAAKGDGITYQWYINRNDGNGFVKLEGAVNASYVTSVTNPGNDGFLYRCTVSDKHGNSVQSNVVKLHVTKIPEIPETGDNSQIGLWFLMLVISMTGMILISQKKRMKHE